MAIVISVWPPVAYLKSAASLPAASSVINASSKKTLRAAYRVASIDDEPFLHRDKLRELGFNIGYYNRLDAFEPGESPQIFLCDIMGIEPSAKMDGVWTMSEVRRRHPISPLIAYTHLKPADVRYQEARQISDNIIRKSDEIDELVEVLDQHICALNDPKGLWKRFEEFFRDSSYASKDIAVIEHYFVESFEKGDPDLFWKKSEKVSRSGVSSLIREFSPAIAKTFAGAAVKAIAG